MDYTEVDIRLKQVNPYADILVAKLNEIEFESYAEDEAGLKAYVPTHLLDKNAVKSIIAEVSVLSDLTFTIKQVKKENWNALWESSFEPVYINDHCVIRSNFHNSFSNVEHEIIITPKMSFGTGHHETTSLMMDQMFSLNFKGKSVLDMGSGTGVLAILASKLGAKRVLAIDTDEWAYKNSIENAEINSVVNIKFIHGDVNEIGNSKFDIILSNIDRNIILQDISRYVESIEGYSEILLSGFLEEDIPLVLKKSKQLGLQLVVSKHKNQWQMLHLKRA